MRENLVNFHPLALIRRIGEKKELVPVLTFRALYSSGIQYLKAIALLKCLQVNICVCVCVWGGGGGGIEQRVKPHTKCANLG